MTIQETVEFLSQHQFSVISTVDDAERPESAVLAFGVTDQLQLIFSTNIKSRKALNLQANASVAFVIGWDERKTVQYQGVARPLPPASASKYKEVFYDKNPWARKFEDMPEQQFYLVEPNWVRYTDISTEPWEVAEIELS